MPLDPGLVTHLKVVIRHLIVHDDSDPDPVWGEFDVTIGIAAPGIASLSNRTSVRWKRSVWSGHTYDLRAELGPIAVRDKGGVIAIAGAGAEHDPVLDEQLRGGLAMLGAEHHFGFGGWWRTTNGRHFDLIFAVIPGD